MVSSFAACFVLYIRPNGARPRIVNGMTQQFFVICVPGDLDLWPLTLTFELGRDFCIMYLTAKFDRADPVISEVIVRSARWGQTNKQANKQTHWQTDKQTNKQTPIKTFTSLRYATPVVKYCQLLHNCTKNHTCKGLQWVNDLKVTQGYRKWRYSI